VVCKDQLPWRFERSLKTSAAILLIFVAAAIVVRQLHQARRIGEGGASVWFYDDAARRLYAVPRDTVPPDKHGVRAIVVAARSEEGDPDKRRIAYLETCAPPLKDLLEAVHKALAEGKPFHGVIPPRNSPFFLTNTLVRRPGEAAWRPSNSSEGRKIIGEWRSWRGPDDAPLVVCVP